MGSRKKKKGSSKKKRSSKKKATAKAKAAPKNEKIDRLQTEARLMEQRLEKLRGNMDKEKIKRESLAAVSSVNRRSRKMTRPSKQSRPSSAKTQTRSRPATPQMAAPSPSPSPSPAAPAKPAPVPTQNNYEEITLREHLKSSRTRDRPLTARSRPGTSRSRPGTANRVSVSAYVAPIRPSLDAFGEAANKWLTQSFDTSKKENADGSTGTGTSSNTDPTDDSVRPGNLLEGEYDAAAARREFEEARAEFVGKKEKSEVKQSINNLLDGPMIDDEENRRQFDEARRQWLESLNGTPAKAAEASGGANDLPAPELTCCYQCYKLVDSTKAVALVASVAATLRLSRNDTVKFCSVDCREKFSANSEVLKKDKKLEAKIGEMCLAGQSGGVKVDKVDSSVIQKSAQVKTDHANGQDDGKLEMDSDNELKAEKDLIEKERRLKMRRDLINWVEGPKNTDQQPAKPQVIVELPDN